MNIENIRESFRPKRIRLLFIGESPPASGKFFYLKSAMTTFTSYAFEKTYNKKFSGSEDFLDFFKTCGCYLDDLSHIPVDDMPSEQRERILIDSISALSDRLKTYSPEIIAIALKKIERHAKKAINKASLSCPVYTLPFAGNGHQNKYIEELVNILERHLRRECERNS